MELCQLSGEAMVLIQVKNSHFYTKLTPLFGTRISVAPSILNRLLIGFHHFTAPDFIVKMLQTNINSFNNFSRYGYAWVRLVIRNTLYNVIHEAFLKKMNNGPIWVKHSVAKNALICKPARQEGLRKNMRMALRGKKKSYNLRREIYRKIMKNPFKKNRCIVRHFLVNLCRKTTQACTI